MSAARWHCWPGEAVFVSGTLGDAALGLALRKDRTLAGRWGLTPDEAGHLLQRYARPQPRLALAPALREQASAAMDLSDGLAKDLGRLCAASGCAARVRLLDMPLSPPAAKALAADPTLWDRIVAGGDDYEVLATVPLAAAEKFRSAATIGFWSPKARMEPASDCWRTAWASSCRP